MRPTFARRMAALVALDPDDGGVGPDPPAPFARLTRTEWADLKALSARVRWDGDPLGGDAFDALTDAELVRLEVLLRLSRTAWWRSPSRPARPGAA